MAGWAKTALVLAGLLSALAPARAQNVVAAAAPPASSPLPSLALAPEAPPSLWHGLSVGSEVVGVSSKHGGGIGGDVFARYERQFANNVVLGLEGATGYLPAWGGLGLVRGFDFAEASVLVGYDTGRVMPFVTAGGLLVRPRFGAGAATAGADSLNWVLNGDRDAQALTNVGAGVSVAVTNHLTLTVGVNALNGSGFFLP